MSRLFQPSRFPIPEKGNPKSKNDRHTAGSSNSSSQISGYKALRVSNTSQLRSSTAADQQQEAWIDTYVPPRPSTAKARVIHSNIKIRRGIEEKRIVGNIGKTSFPEDHISTTKIGAGSSAGIKKSVVVPIPPPSLLRKELSLQVKNMASNAPIGAKVIATGAKMTKVPLEETMTPSGLQQVVERVIAEKRLERTKHGEVVAKNVRTMGTNNSTEESVQIEENFQKFNPDFPTPKGYVKEIVSVLNERDLTASYEINRKNIIREITKLNLAVGMELDKVEHLVEEEREDISNILTNASPELVNQASELFSLKKRLQHLRLSPENTKLLGESLIVPTINASLPLPEASPELIATIMDTSERAANHSIPTEQLFNSLFPPGHKEKPSMILSSATPGPIEDVVIPTVLHHSFQETMLSSEMEQVAALVHLTDQRPPEDGFAKLLPSQPRRRGRRRRPYQPLSDEYSPLSNEALLVSIEAVGARPTFSLHASNIFESASHGTLMKETSKGIEYILDCQPVQYFSKVQLRGSHPPPWFPGYMVALSNTSNSVALAKSPSEVLLSAWKSVQPEVFSDDSVLYN